MATYLEIQVYVIQKHGWQPAECWIADVLESHGLTKRRAWNRKGEERIKPCPPDKRMAIEEALRHYKMI